MLDFGSTIHADKDGIIPPILIFFGLFVIFAGLVHIILILMDFVQDYVTRSLGLGLIPIGLFIFWVGYCLRKFGKIYIPPAG